MALALVALLPALAWGQEEQTDSILDQQERRYTMYGVMFYNLENLFDTINSPGVNDIEFTPQGARQWNGTKYWQKQHNMAYAISQMEVPYRRSEQSRSFVILTTALTDSLWHKTLNRQQIPVYLFRVNPFFSTVDLWKSVAFYNYILRY